jgi:putative nucleotide binding protein
MEKEEIAVVLDYLPYGYPLENRTMPVVQAIGKNNFTLLQLVPRKGETFQLAEDVYIGEGKRDKIQFIQGRLLREKLTETAKMQLAEFISEAVKEKEQQFVDFFNKAQAINTRLHQLELLPGLGKKHCQAILDEKDKKPFESMADIKTRVQGVPDPQKAIEKRIFEELTEIQRHNLFIR